MSASLGLFCGSCLSIAREISASGETVFAGLDSPASLDRICGSLPPAAWNVSTSGAVAETSGG
eukprot:2236225-Pyramimonas_sp.AAC.1